MATIHIAYETSTGRILVAHHTGSDPGNAGLALEQAMQIASLSEGDISVISLPADEVDATRLNRVDPSRKTLTEAKPDEGGVSFSFSGTQAPSETA